jgi:hypothetical protein
VKHVPYTPEKHRRALWSNVRYATLVVFDMANVIVLT